MIAIMITLSCVTYTFVINGFSLAYMYLLHPIAYISWVMIYIAHPMHHNLYITLHHMAYVAYCVLIIEEKDIISETP